MNLTQLKQAAEAATPGPWMAAGPSFGDPMPRWLDSVVQDDGSGTDSPIDICRDAETSDAEFIAACDPQTILKLIAIARAARDYLATDAYSDKAREPSENALRQALEGVMFLECRA